MTNTDNLDDHTSAKLARRALLVTLPVWPLALQWIDGGSMGPKRAIVEFHGEYDEETHLLTGIWVSFPGSWRPPFLWSDLGALVQTLNDYRKNCPEFTQAKLDSLELGESILCEDIFEYEVLNALGSPLHWELPLASQEPEGSEKDTVDEMPGARGGGHADSATGGGPRGAEPLQSEKE